MSLLLCGVEASLAALCFQKPSSASGWSPAPLLAVRGARVLDDHVGGLLANHVDGRDDEVAGYLREDRRVHHAQPLDPPDAEAAVEHGRRVAFGADGARAGGVVAPRLVPDELAELVVGLKVGAGNLLLFDEARAEEPEPARA